MTELTSYFILAFSSLFTLVNPIGIPLIAGPGAISSVMVFSSEAENWEYKFVLLGVITLVMSLTYFIFQMADNLAHRFGTIGLRITQRIMGLILMVIAIEFVIDGMGAVVMEWLKSA